MTRFHQLLTACLVTSTFVAVVNPARVLSSRVQSRIFQLQEQMCGRQFCEGDPLGYPPLCMEESSETNTSEPEIQTHPPRLQHKPPCAQCNCNDNCRLYGDCCADKHIGGQFYFDCEEIKIHRNDHIDTYHSYVVKHCPVDAPGYSRELAEQCEQGQLGYIQDGRHVSAPGDFNTSVTFRNKYCALCYNITDFSPWDVIVSCQAMLDTSDVVDLNGLIRLANASSSCTVSYSTSDIIQSYVCERFSDVIINFCNTTGRWQEYDAEIEQACHAYINPIKSYRNIFCALCNGETVAGLICSSSDYVLPSNPPVIMPFSAILNFERSDAEIIKGENSGYPILRIGRQEERDCRLEDVFDNIADKCREMYCPIKNPLRENCVQLLKSEDLVLTTMTITGYYWNYLIIPFGFGLRTDIGTILAMEYADTLTECGTSVIEFSSRDFVAIHSTTELIYRQTIIELVLFLQENSTLEYSWQCMASKNNITTNVTLWQKSISVNFVQETRFDNVPELIATPLEHRVFPSFDTIDETNLTKIPFGFNLSCTLIRFHIKEINISNGLLIVHNETKLENNRYFIRDGEQYFVCLDDLQPPYTEPYTEGPVRSDSLSAETILTGVCLSCSLLCLLLTLLVYILLRELHTVPGLNLILLTSSLFVAQALYLFGAGAVTTPTICTVLAVLIHYFWLVSFGWMNVCCIHMFRVFNNLFDSMNFADNKCCLVFKYSAFSYGVPACIVGATILTSYFTSESGNIGYGGSQICFVSPGLTAVYSFGVPVGLTVLSNTGLLIYTMVQVRRAKNGYLSVDKNGASDVSKFFKLSTITGVSWVFGFLGYFLQRVELLYVFTVLTAGQGVFIFLSFVVSRRVWGMVKGRCAARARRNHANKYTESALGHGTMESEFKGPKNTSHILTLM